MRPNRTRSLTESLLTSINRVRGIREAGEKDEDEDDPKEDAPKDDFLDDEGEEDGEGEGGGGEEDTFGDEFDDELEDEGGEEDLEGLEDVGDMDLEDDSDIPDDFDDEFGGELGGDSELPSPDDLNADEPPGEGELDMFGDGMGGEDAGLEKSSEFREFVTNQLIDYPVEDVEFEEVEGAQYIDAKFGDKAVSFCLYQSEDGQPLLAILHDNEVSRIELPPESVTGETTVRDEFMPIEWIRDHLARIVDVAPEFEAYRFKTLTKRCNEVLVVRRKVSTMRESSAINRKPMSKPKQMKKGKVNSGPTSTRAGKAKLGGEKIKPPTKSGGKAGGCCK